MKCNVFVLFIQHVTLYVTAQNGETVLHAAALFGHLKAVRLLLQSGIKADVKNAVNYFHRCSTLFAKFELQIHEKMSIKAFFV